MTRNGWALLDGAVATTKSIRLDEELLRETLAANPEIVSIDSPLSMPDGVTDADNIGNRPIYRRCELALKRMGISVFWCLLPTMKSLTMRGMWLASELRKKCEVKLSAYSAGRIHFSGQLCVVAVSEDLPELDSRKAN